MTATPTPRLWEAIQGRPLPCVRQNYTLWHDDNSEDGHTVAVLKAATPADAAFIITAVNTHDPLVSALQDAEERLAEDIEDDPDSSMTAETLRKVRAALKLLEGAP